jgi:quercetin 2,3-dioxygenase
MIELRPFSKLGHERLDWLDTHYHFSFAQYRDPERMGWGTLRVWNDDEIAPGQGFPPHPHADMEIVTYVRDGAVTHQDSLGNKGRTEAGDVQVMSAGSGIRHAEYNLEGGPTRLFQIWIIPSERGGAPHWGTRPFPNADRAGRFVVLASGRDGDGDALPIRADARVLGANLKAGDRIDYDLAPGRHAYLVSVSGTLDINGVSAAPRDGIAVRDEPVLRLSAREDTDVILVDAP